MKVITILEDSISMIRQEEGIYLQDLYSYKLQEKLTPEYYVLNNSIRGGHIKIQNENISKNLFSNNPSVVIIFFGIVDCFPRLFDLKEQKIMSILSKLKLNIINNFFIKIKSSNRYFFTKIQKKVYTKIEDFERIYTEIIIKIEKLKEVEKIILINIAAPNEDLKRKNYKIEENISNYNEIIYKISKKSEKIILIDFYDLIKNNFRLLLNYGIHINKECHEKLSNLIYEKII